MVHDSFGTTLFGQELGHFLHLLFTFFDLVDTNITDQGNIGTHGGSGTGFGIFDCNAFLGLDTKLLACVEVDSRVRFGGWWGERGGSRIDVFIGEEVVDVGLLQGSHDTRFGRCANNGHWVALRFDPFELLHNTIAGSSLCLEFGSNFTKLTVDILVDLLWAHGEVVCFLKAIEHATEVVSDEVVEELLDRVAFRESMFFHDPEE